MWGKKSSCSLLGTLCALTEMGGECRANRLQEPWISALQVPSRLLFLNFLLSVQTTAYITQCEVLPLQNSEVPHLQKKKTKNPKTQKNKTNNNKKPQQTGIWLCKINCSGSGENKIQLAPMEYGADQCSLG